MGLLDVIGFMTRVLFSPGILEARAVSLNQLLYGYRDGLGCHGWIMWNVQVVAKQ